MARQHAVACLNRWGAVILPLMGALLALAASACSSDTAEPQPGGLQITPEVTTMLSGDSVQLHFPHGLFDTTLHWSATGGLSVSPTGMLRAVYSGSGRVIASRTDSTGTSGDTLNITITLPHTFTSVAVGFRFACALDTSGTAYCWGSNEGGRLATDLIDPVVGDWAVAPGAVRVHAPVPFVSIATGGAHACGLTAGGEAYCWGFNNHGQIGVTAGVKEGCPENSSYCLRPMLVPDGHRFSALSLGMYDSCGLVADGAAFCWGDNSNGGLGIGGMDGLAHPTPTAVIGGHQFRSISAGEFHTCAVTTDNHAYCWGYNSWGNLGIDSAEDYTRHDPTMLQSDPPLSSVTVANQLSCGLNAAGAAFCWGAGWLGGSWSAVGVAVPAAVSGGLAYSTLSAGFQQTCGLVSGAAYCWGAGPEIGSGTTGGTPTSLDPVAVTGGLTFTTISAGGYLSCGIASTSHVYCWGTHPFLGVTDSTIDRNYPVEIAGQQP
jgi:alpha-tubulin suppressor-like RCC1 family protein